MNVHASALGKLAHAPDREALCLTTRALEAAAGMKPNPMFEPPVLELKRSQIVGRANG